MKSDVIHVTSEGTGTDPFLMHGMTGGSMDIGAATANLWSFIRYKDYLEQSNSPREEWDELEKSIVANIADEVQISIRDTTVEMVIFKKF